MNINIHNNAGASGGGVQAPQKISLLGIAWKYTDLQRKIMFLSSTLFLSWPISQGGV